MGRRVNFRPGWRLTAFTLVFLPVFLSLGQWQLNRAEQKTQLEGRIAAGERSVTVLAPGEPPEDFRRYQLTGRLDADHLWLLDNRTHRGRSGYEVWAPLVTDSGWYLASLGWVAGEARRDTLPEVRVPTVRRPWLVQGRPAGETIQLAETDPENAWPQRIQALDTAAMAERLGRDAALGLLQLEPGQAGVGPVIWTPSVMSAERHRGYALQWFAMAAALLMMYLYAGRRSAERTKSEENTE